MMIRQVKIYPLILILIMALSGSLVMASDVIKIGGLDGLNQNDQEDDYYILLALSGGGARGLTVIGILQAFEEKNIHVVGVTGTSMGGIIGGLYASGYSPYQLDSIIKDIDFNNLFSNSPPRRSMFLTKRLDRDRHLISIRFDNFIPIIPKALTAGQQLTSLLTELTSKANYKCQSDFLKLPIPFKTICTDIVSGEKVVLDKGSLADAMRATMAFPLAFTGVEDEKRILMDGGMVSPIPVELARTLSDTVNFVVAISTASQLAPREDLTTPVDIANQVTTIMTHDKLLSELAKADYKIMPNLTGISANDFKLKDSLIELGYQIGLLEADNLIKKLKESSEQTVYMVEDIAVEDPGINSDYTELINKPFKRNELIRQLKKIAVKNDLFELKTEIDNIGQINDTILVRLNLSGYENFKYSEIKFEFIGNTIFDELTLAKQFVTYESKLNFELFKRGLDKIIALYDTKGYDLVHIKDVVIEPENSKISITIDEAIIERIDIENNRRTKDWFVRSYASLKRGLPYSTQKASESIRNIYGTNLFDRVTIDVMSSQNGVIAKISVEEKTYSQIRLGWHWHDEFKSEEFIEYLDDNVAGIGLEYLLHAQYSDNREVYYLSLKTDRIFSTYLTSKFSLYHNRLDRVIYTPSGIDELGVRQEIKSGVNMSLGQQIARLGTLTADLKIEENEYADSLFTGEENKFEYGLRVIELKSLVENYNQLPYPEKGNRHLFQIQFAGKYLGGDVEYTKFFTQHEMYIPIGEYLNYHPRIMLGVSRSGLPPPEKFFMGGHDSFYGLRTYNLSGDKMFIISNEFRFKLPLRLYLSFRYDMGDVYVSTDQIKLKNVRHGFGGKLSLDSPLGPIDFGLGTTDDGFDNMYINVGLDF